MLRRKELNALARIVMAVRTRRGDHQADDLAALIAEVAQENPHFDRERWDESCLVNSKEIFDAKQN